MVRLNWFKNSPVQDWSGLSNKLDVTVSKTVPVMGWGGLNKKSNVKMSKNVQDYQLCIICKISKIRPVVDWDSLSKKSNVKMSKECIKLTVMYNMSIVKKSNS